MALNTTSRVISGTTGTDNLTSTGSWEDTFKMTADDWVTDTIDGGAGIDTIDYSGSRVAVHITLTDPTSLKGASGGSVTAEFTEDSITVNGTTYDWVHHQTVAQLTSIENATGSSHDDVLTGNSGDNKLDGGFGDDVVSGGAGDDAIIGNFGRDVLSGGADSDTFVFDGVVQSGWRYDANGQLQYTTTEIIDSQADVGRADVITDFEQGIDHINLRGIDASISASGDQAFTFIGTAQFTGHAGELHEYFSGVNGAHVVQGDVDGDAVADFSIVVQGLAAQTHMHASDFLL